MSPRDPFGRCGVLALVLVATAATACRTESRPPDPLTPPLAVVDWGPPSPQSSESTGAQLRRTGCPAQLADTLNGTRLTLVRAQSRTEGTSVGAAKVTQARSTGDYVVLPAGRFEVGPGKLLRVNCDALVGIAFVDSTR